jgi:peptidoglycan/xylan/chitin deacetylase (PgdA/CDA1 family)
LKGTWNWRRGAAAALLLLWGAAAVLPFWLPAPAVGADAALETEEPAEKLIALTFDDGPRLSTTAPLLDGLKERGVHATFFLIGRQVEKYPQLVCRMAAEGHAVGIHTYDHVKVQGLSEAEFYDQTDRCAKLLKDLLGREPALFRPPYGLVDDCVRQWSPYPLILWSVDPEDWKYRDAQREAEHIISQVQDGGIVLLHDFYPESVEAALTVIDALQGAGYRFCTVPELFAARGITLEAGETYRQAD